MTAPVDDNPEEGPSEHSIPPWLRQRSTRRSPASRGVPLFDDRPRFGDEASNADPSLRDLRIKFAMAPQQMPEPPVRERSLWRPVASIVALVAAAAIGANVLTLSTAGRPAVEQASSQAGARGRQAAPSPMVAAPARLVSTEQQRNAVNEAVPLPVKLSGGQAAGTLAISGLAPGTLISVGTPVELDGWHVPATEAEGALILPPADFTGIMDITVALVLPTGEVGDRRTARLDWTASPLAAAPGVPSASPAVQPAVSISRSAEEIAALVERGRAFLAAGDIASARLMLQRAAEGGDSAAALMLGSTFDPKLLGRLAAIGITPDPAQAARWYRHAANLGSAEARGRLDALSSR